MPTHALSPVRHLNLSAPRNAALAGWRVLVLAGVLSLLVPLLAPAIPARAEEPGAGGTWTQTGALAHDRQRHTASLLDDGTVLVAGGSGSGIVSERYNPDTGAWTVTGALGTARASHTATVLPDGRVLVAGGNTPTGVFSYVRPVASAELYDPATGSWTETAPMSVPRTEHVAALLDGPACDGDAQPAWCGRVLVTGGVPLSFSTGSDQSELYDPDTGTWSSCAATLAGATCPGPTNHQRRAATATPLPEGGVLLAGGVTDFPTVPPSTERYHPSSGTWSSCSAEEAHASCPGPLVKERFEHAAAALSDDRVLLTGGRGQSGGTDVAGSAETYEPGTGTWTEVTPMRSERRQHTATLLPDGSMLVAGGGTGSLGAEAERYLPTTGAWQATPPMHHPRGTHTATLVDDGSVLIVGGGVGAALRSAEIFALDQGPETCWTPPRVSGTTLAPPPSPPPVVCPRM